MTTVITYGTFDMFHVGHLNLIKRMREIGDRVIIGVSTDEFNQAKGKYSLVPFKERREIVSALRDVDFVIAEENWEQKVSDVEKYDVDVFVMGDDWLGEFDYLQDYCQVRYLPRTSGVCSTDLRKSLDRLLEHDPSHTEATDLLRAVRRGLS